MAEVSKWQHAYAGLEPDLNDHCRFRFEKGAPVSLLANPAKVVQAAGKAVGVGFKEPIRDICGLLEENGVKLPLLETNRDSFFGLSVGAYNGGLAIVVHTWSRISVERWIFTAARAAGARTGTHLARYVRRLVVLPSVPEEVRGSAFATVSRLDMTPA